MSPALIITSPGLRPLSVILIITVLGRTGVGVGVRVGVGVIEGVLVGEGKEPLGGVGVGDTGGWVGKGVAWGEKTSSCSPALLPKNTITPVKTTARTIIKRRSLFIFFYCSKSDKINTTFYKNNFLSWLYL